MWTPQPQSKDVQRIFTLFKQEPQERFLPSFCSGGMRNILSETQKSSLRRELPSVYCLLTRTFSLKFLHVYDANVQYTNARTLREVLPCTFPLWEMREPVGLLTQVYSGSIWEYSLVATMRISCQTVSPSYISKIHARMFWIRPLRSLRIR